jgi:hypothetical protein
MQPRVLAAGDFFATALIATRQLICLPAANSFAQAAVEI